MVFHPASPPARVQGAPESLLDRCSHVRVGTSVMPMNASIRQEILKNIKFYGTGMPTVYALIVSFKENSHDDIIVVFTI